MNDATAAVPEVTVLCLVRHGHATAAACIDRLYASTRLPIRLLYVEVGSPPPLREALDAKTTARPNALFAREHD